MQEYTSEFMKNKFGQVELTPKDSLVALNYYSLRFEITIGEYGMDDGSHVKIAWPCTSSFGIPQFEDPTSENYTSVKTTGNAELKLKFDFNGYIRPFNPVIFLKIYDGTLKHGDKIIITMGDQSGGGKGFLAQSYIESNIEFKVLLDPFGTNKYSKLPDSPFIDIVASDFAKYRLLTQSEVKGGEKQWVAVIAEDIIGNVVTAHKGEITINCEGNEIASFKFQSQHKGVIREYIKIELPSGVYNLYLKDQSIESNPFIINTEKPELNRYFGDIHGQTGESVGSGTIIEYLEFGKNVAQLDYISHAANAFQITKEIWKATQDAIKSYNEERRYVAFLGYEWSGVTPAGGDHNVYYLNDDMPIHRCSHALIEDKSDLDTDRYPVGKLYEEFKGRKDVLIIPHIGGRRATLDVFDPELTPFIEIVSVHGHFHWFLEEAIENNLLTGFVGSSDTHSLRPGLSVPVSKLEAVKSGLSVVYAKELTRESLWEAFKKRHVYATTGTRILLEVTFDEFMMGDEIEIDKPNSFNIKAIGTSGILRIDLFAGNEIIDSYIPSGELSDTVQVWWTGARTVYRRRNLNWSGQITVKNGKIISAKQIAFDLPDESIQKVTDNTITFKSSTAGDYDGIEMKIDGNDETIIDISTPQGNLEASMKDLEEAKKVNLGDFEKRIEIFRHLKEGYSRDVTWNYELTEVPLERTPYYVRVEQIDGEKAWSSPIFISKK